MPWEDALAGHVKLIATGWLKEESQGLRNMTHAPEALGPNPLSLWMIETDTKKGFLVDKGNNSIPIQ